MDNEDKLLIQEYCYIRTKQEHKAPDVKKAWDQFEHEHIMKKVDASDSQHKKFLAIHYKFGRQPTQTFPRQANDESLPGYPAIHFVYLFLAGVPNALPQTSGELKLL